MLTPHDGEHLYAADDISPDGKKVLITSNGDNGYQNVGWIDITINADNGRQDSGWIDIAIKKIVWLTKDKWEIQGGGFSPDGKHVTWTANVDGNTDIYVHDLVTGKTASLPLPKGVNDLAGRSSSVHQRWVAPALLPQRADRSERFVGALDGDRKIAPGHALTGSRNARRGHGRAFSGALPEQRRQVDHLRVRLHALQPATQRAAPGHCVRARRARVANRQLPSTASCSTWPTRATS